MKSNKRQVQQSNKRAAKLRRVTTPGGKSTYAAKQASGSRYWKLTEGIREVENRAC